MIVFLAWGIVISVITELVHRRLARTRQLKSQAEAALAEANSKLMLERDILQAVMNGAGNSHLAYLDREFNFVCVNETYARTCGYSPKAMIGKNHFDLYPHVENETIFARVRDTGEAVQYLDKPFEFSDKPERGMTYWDWALTPVRGVAGNVTGLIFSLFETTLRKRTEEVLRESEERFRIAFEDSAVAMTMTTLDGRIQKVNQAFSKMLGYSESELTGQRFTELTHSDDLPENLVGVRRLLQGEIASFRMDKRYLTRDGRIVWGDMSTNCVMDPQGVPLYLLTNIQDITSRKGAEVKLQEMNELLEKRVIERTEELREKDLLLVQQNRLAAMGEMINNIAHQWRQPLNALGLNVQQLRLFHESGQLRKDLLYGAIDNAMMLVRHMSGTIDDFRDFFKPDSERVEFSVKDVVAGAIKLVDASFRSNEIAIVVNCPDNPVVFGYPNQYAQVILNLLGNARDAFDTCRRSNARIVFNLGRRGNRSVLTVTDNAGGIPDAIIDRVFEPHFSTKGQRGQESVCSWQKTSSRETCMAASAWSTLERAQNSESRSEMKTSTGPEPDLRKNPCGHCRLERVYGEGKGECRSFSEGRLHPDRSPVPLDDFLAQSQTNAGPRILLPGVKPLKNLKNFVKMVRIDADAVITY